MASTAKRCIFHEDTLQSFCLVHIIYCCPKCHQRFYPDCSVLAKDDAINHFQGKLKKSASKIHVVMQNCQTLLASLQDKLDSIRHENEAAIDCVTTFCDQLQATINSFLQQSLDKIKVVSTERVDRITDQLQTCEELKAHLKELSEIADINEIPAKLAETVSTDQIPRDLVHSNVVTNQLGDELASAEIQIDQIGEISSEEMDHSIPIAIDSSINTQLCEQLTRIRESIGKYPEGCSGGTSVGQSESSMQSDCATEESAEEPADTQHMPTERDTPRTFRPHSRFSHPGKNRVVRFAHTPAGLRLLVSSTNPDQISIVDEKGRVSITEEMDTEICDMFVLDEQVYATADDECSIRVFRLSDLSLVRQITTEGSPGSIICTDHDMVISLCGNNESVCRIAETGVVTHTSSYEFCSIYGILEISHGNNILVSDYEAHTIVILSADLSHIDTISGPHIVTPYGLCLVGESVFVACEEPNTVIELDVLGRYKRTVLGEEDELKGPYQISYDSESYKFIVSPYVDSDEIVVFVGES